MSRLTKEIFTGAAIFMVNEVICRLVYGQQYILPAKKCTRISCQHFACHVNRQRKDEL
jgi:hypothetical protein